MEPNNQDDLASRLLDAALQHHGDAEPRPGLEARILVSFGEEREKASSRIDSWAALGAIASVAVVADGTIFWSAGPLSNDKSWKNMPWVQ